MKRINLEAKSQQSVEQPRVETEELGSNFIDAIRKWGDSLEGAAVEGEKPSDGGNI